MTTNVGWNPEMEEGYGLKLWKSQYGMDFSY
jgi:hypothetical protein